MTIRFDTRLQVNSDKESSTKRAPSQRLIETSDRVQASVHRLFNVK